MAILRPFSEFAHTQKAAMSLWYHQGADAISATVSYYMLFAITPLLLLVIMFVGQVYGTASVANALTEWGRVLGPEMVKLLTTSVVNLETIANSYSIPVIGVLFFSSMVVVMMNTYTNGLHSLWGIKRSGIRAWWKKSLRSVTFILVFVVYLSIFLAVDDLISATTQQAAVGLQALLHALFFVFLTTLLMNAALYILPAWHPSRHARLYGGLVTSTLLYLTKSFVALYLVFTPTPGLFGAAGLILVFLIWGYASAAIVFYGAAVAYVSDHARGLLSLQ